MNNARSWLEIDLAAIRENLRRLRVHCGAPVEIMPAVKADAYGHGAVEISRTLIAAGVKNLAVASAVEGAELRQIFPDSAAVAILILGAVLPDEIPLAISQDLTFGVHDFAGAEAINRAAAAARKIAGAYLKIDSGMGRLGALPEMAIAIAPKISALPNLRLHGAFMHFANAENPASVGLQLEIFNAAVASLKAAGVKIPRLHAANSAAAICYPDARFAMIRPGAAIYGFHDAISRLEKFPLVPAMAWKTRIAQLKDYPPNSPLGYGGAFVTARRAKIAAVPVGYADGYSRFFGNRARVLIAGNFAPVVGRISMDYTLADVTDLPPTVKIGDEVILLGADGNKKITLEQLAELAGTIPYEIATSARPRGGRVYRAGIK